MQDLVSPVIQIARDVLSNLIGKAVEDRFRPIIEEEVQKQIRAVMTLYLPLLQKQPSFQIDIGAISIAVMKEVYAIADTSRVLDVSNGSITIRPAFVTKPAEILPAIFQPAIEADASIEDASIISGQDIKDIVERRSREIQRIILEEENQR